MDEAETATQIVPEDVQVVQEVNHLLKSIIAGPMLKSIGKRVECGQCEVETVKVSPKKSVNPGPERAAQAVQEVNHLLKGIAGPMLKSAGHGGDLEAEGTGLLDGELAHGATQLYQNPMNGTVLSETPVEPIVPLRGLVELGYAITWSRAGCVVKHPRLGKIECWLRSGCPVVRKDHALALITEIERMDAEKRTNRRFHAGRIG